MLCWRRFSSLPDFACVSVPATKPAFWGFIKENMIPFKALYLVKKVCSLQVLKT